MGGCRRAIVSLSIRLDSSRVSYRVEQEKTNSIFTCYVTIYYFVYFINTIALSDKTSRLYQ